MFRIRTEARTKWTTGLGFLAYLVFLSDPRPVDWYETFGLLLLAATIVVQIHGENS